jgi:membrane-bound lytic murein transglycosylase D
MKKGCLIFISLGISLVGCAHYQDSASIYGGNPGSFGKGSETAALPEDSLKRLITDYDKNISALQTEIDSLSSYIQDLEDSIRFLNSTVRLRDHSEFPDSIIFAGYTFDLTNDRLFQKFKYWYEQEVKYAYRYIPRSGKYFPIIEDILQGYNLPDDLKYLAVAESYLNPFAKSSAGALGYWQFIKSTAKYYGLTVNQFVDLRMDIFASTDAACRYILNSYNELKRIGANDMLLAVCSFNAGLGNIKRVIQEQGGKDFFSLIQYKSETDNYIWRALAIKYIFENEDKIFTKTLEKEESLLETCKPVSLTLKGYYKLDEWAQAQGTVIRKVWELNPWIKIYERKQYQWSPINDVVLPPGTYTVLLPKDAVPNPEKVAAIERQFMQENQGYNAVQHIVKSGENLTIIARRYNTTVSELMRINGLSSSTIYPGQRLMVFSSGANNNNYYVVREGDSLYEIAQRLGVSPQTLIQKNNLAVHKQGDSTIVYIYPGQKLYY